MEQQRPTGDGFMAADIDLGHSSFWWTQANLPPPGLANRPDILYEMEENTSTKRGGRAMVSKDVYVLYNDYSQTTINATFDKADPSQVTLEQKHERPPPSARKDQLENASEAYGAVIASAAANAGKQGATVGDGTAHGFILELLRPLGSNVLMPIGTRAYGALIYANMSNASTQQFDEIRPGDIISFRNAKFSGHKGGLHQKYSLEAGKPDHVAVVAEWDGTKKKISAWEQRSEDDRKEKKRAKVREESYRVGDLKSGEVRVWRVMGREYVGWDKS
jgi:myosin tail region-interacting protein MTI1